MLRLSKNQSIEDRAYYRKLRTLRTLHTPEFTRYVAYCLAGIMFLFFIVLFLPWQQNITADGSLTALNPQDRPQEVPTPIDGRVAEWYVQEGQYVEDGQVLVVLEEVKDKYLDPELLNQLDQQINAKQGSIASKEQKIIAKENSLEALREGLEIKLEQLENKIEQSELKIQSNQNAVTAAQTDLDVARRQLAGADTLFREGLVPQVKYETAQSKFQQAQAKLVKAQNDLDASRNDLAIARTDRNAVRAETADKVAKIQSEIDETRASIAESRGELAKSENEFSNVEARTGQRIIRAPQDGYIIKSLINGIGETVKENAPLFTLMPENPQKAAEIYVKAMDVALLDTGRHVRLEFDGWPALQFSGWPRVAVGTFGGRVVTIDQFISKGGKYRVLVLPDYKYKDDSWPNQLRLGSGVVGRIMLDEVPVWYEIWRQLNGFPPSLQAYEENADGNLEKKAK